MKELLKRGVWSVVAAVGLCSGVASASSIYTFDLSISNNNPVDAATGHQYSVEVSDAGGGLVSFMFRNDPAGVQSSIARVYFENGGPLNSLVSVNNGPGVNFTAGTGGPGPNNVPAAENAPFQPFQTTDGMLAKAAAPPPSNGIQPGQFMELIFSLQMGSTFQDVIDAIDQGISGPIDDNSLRLAIHVIDFESGGSESFMLVPLPGAFAMGLLGLCGIAAFQSRKSSIT